MLKQFCAFIFVLFAQFYNLYGNNYITIIPGSCPNCMAVIELMDQRTNVYVLKEDFRIDSVSLRSKYSFLRNAPLIFSDSLFKRYSVDGQMSISNPNGSLRYPLSEYTRKVHRYFTQWTTGSNLDTITYTSFPFAKASIRKRLFCDDGKVWLLNNADNNVILFNLLEDKVLDTVSIPEESIRKAYFLFGLGKDTGSYRYYKKLLQPYIQTSLNTINDISVNGDTLFAYVMNSFAFFGGEHGLDTFIAHFQSIITFVNGVYKETYVPTNIQERLTDTTSHFFAEEAALYRYKNKFFLTIYNSMFHSEQDKYVVGSFLPLANRLDWVVQMEGEENKSYNVSNPLFYNNYCMLAKSTKLYDLSGQNRYMDLHYFNQGNDQNTGYLPDYVNFGFRVDGNICSVLYNVQDRNQSYIAKINIANNEIVMNKPLPQIDNKLIRSLSPFDANDIVQFSNNYKVIKYRIAP